MQRGSIGAAVLAAVTLMPLSGCSGETTASGAASSGSTGSAGAATTGSSSASPGASATEKETEDIDLGSFGEATTVDNSYFPLKPGARLEFTGASEVDGERLNHEVVFTVTDLVKKVGGVDNVVIYELDYTDGVLNEAELAFFAQDDGGTVWHLGQYPEVYEGEKLVEAPTWIAGQEGAKAGITMKADPQLGQPSYSQGWGPAVDWKDRARLIRLGEETCVKAGCYSDVLVNEEFVVDEPDAFQLKYYAPGVGNVKVGYAGAADKDKEELELVLSTTLDAAALADVHQKALALEKSAYEVSPDVYGTTEPMRPRSS